MLDQALRPLLERPLERAGRVAAARVSANQVSVAGFAAGIIAAALVAADLAPFGLVFLVLCGFADGLDGAVARLRGPTALGAFLDTALDLIVYAALPLAFAIRAPENALAAAFLLVGFVSMMTLELVLRLCAGKESSLPSPLLGHGETFLVFAVACAYPPAFPPLAYIYGALCFAAGGVRIAAAVTHLRGAGEP